MLAAELVIGCHIAGERPDPASDNNPGIIDRSQRRLRGRRQRVDQPRHRRIGGHPAEHRRLGPQQPDIGQAVTADGDADRQIQQDLPGSSTAHCLRHGTNAADSSRSKPTFPAVATSNTAPAWDTTRFALVSTVNRG